MVRRLTLSLVLVLAGFVAGLVVTGRMRTASESIAAERHAATAVISDQRTPPSPASAAGVAFSSGGPDFTRVAGQAVKGVANISSLQVVRQRNSPFSNDPFFRYFFGDDEQFGSRDRRSLSLGSGVIISTDGYVVTNSHVVGENVREITIALPDKREVKGKVIGTDPVTDIALLKIGVTGLPVVPWGDSGQLKVGEWVLAIGSPFQLSQTVTAGIVSATGRTNMGFAEYEDFIQTDAAINPGNSGGPLLDSAGRVIGVNTAIFSPSGASAGIGFAIPVDVVNRVVPELIRSGRVPNPGIGIITAPESATARLGMDGVVVVRTLRGSPAATAGIRGIDQMTGEIGDIIVAVNGKPVRRLSDLTAELERAGVGKPVQLTVARGGRTTTVSVTIADVGRTPL